MHRMPLKRISNSGLGITLLLTLTLASGVQASNIPKIKPDISFTDPTNGASDCLTGNNITHYDKCSPAGELERQALYRSPFFGLLMVYQKIHDLYKKMNVIINKNPATNQEYEQFIMMESDIILHYWSYNKIYNVYNNLMNYYKERPTYYRSCYRLRTKIIEELNHLIRLDKIWTPRGRHDSAINEQGFTRWFDDNEKEIIDNIIGYIPKWWEHTDLGFACKLFFEEIKDVDGTVIGDIPSYPEINGHRHAYFTNNAGGGSPYWINTEYYSWIMNRKKNHVAKRKNDLEKAITTLKKVLGVEILEARAHFNGPLNKICSPHTDQHYVTGDINDPASPAWHRVFSSAVLDTTQFPTTTYPVHNILLSAHPNQNYSSDKVKQYLMTKDPRYITFYSSTPNPKEGYYPGLPMIFVPGTDYVPPALLSGGITVYAYPPAVCTKNTDSTLPIRIFN